MRRRFLNNEGFSSFYNFEDYLTIESLEDDLRVSFSSDIEYGIDGKGWKTLSFGSEIIAKSGQLISFKGTFVPNSEIGIGRDGIGKFTINKKCRLRGNILSLLWSDEAKGKVDLTGYKNAFVNLFSGCSYITEIDSTFLPATTLAEYCYYHMFYGCTSLTTAPELPATTLAEYCYYHMFYGCTSLTTAPELPATTLANSCYGSMFYNCTSLTTSPELPAAALTNDCYSYMFYGCTKLTSAPELPATALTNDCYYGMFRGCTSLTTAPELPATTLANDCYNYMFYGCRNLNYIKMLATDISVDDCLYYWVSDVSSTGTFVKNPAMTSLPIGYSGIPSGWTVVDDGEESGGTGGPITFRVQDTEGLITEYTIPYQMTWEDFVNSEYNKIWYEKYYEFEIYNGRVWYKEFPVQETDYIEVIPSAKIKEIQYYAI